MESIQDWGTAVMTSLAGAMTLLVAAIPRIIGFLVILIIGWFIASLIAKGVAVLLRSVRFNELSQRAGVSDFISRMGVKADSSGLLALVVKWFVRLIALVVAFDALGVPAVSQVLRDFLLWLPNLVVAMVVVVLGGVAARAVASLVRGTAARAQLGNPQLLSSFAAGVIWAFTLVVAVNQLGIGETLVNTLFIATVGAAALAIGLAFGLGGRDTAQELLRTWRDRSQQAAARIKTSAAPREAARASPGTAQRLGETTEKPTVR